MLSAPGLHRKDFAGAAQGFNVTPHTIPFGTWITPHGSYFIFLRLAVRIGLISPSVVVGDEFPPMFLNVTFNPSSVISLWLLSRETELGKLDGSSKTFLLQPNPINMRFEFIKSSCVCSFLRLITKSWQKFDSSNIRLKSFPWQLALNASFSSSPSILSSDEWMLARNVYSASGITSSWFAEPFFDEVTMINTKSTSAFWFIQ